MLQRKDDDKVKKEANARGEFLDALNRAAGVRGTVDAQQLGKWLSRHVGQIQAGLRFVRDGTGQGHVARWKVERAKPDLRVVE